MQMGHFTKKEPTDALTNTYGTHKIHSDGTFRARQKGGGDMAFCS